MRRKRKNCTPEEKVRILKEHLVNGVPVSELCEQHHLQPTVFYRWQRQLFEQGAAAFQSNPNRETNQRYRKLENWKKKWPGKMKSWAN